MPEPSSFLFYFQGFVKISDLEDRAYELFVEGAILDWGSATDCGVSLYILLREFYVIC